MKTTTAFVRELRSVADATHQPTTDEALRFYFKALEPFGEDACVQAIRACAARSVGSDFVRVPTPGDIIEQIRADRRDKWEKANNLDGPRLEGWEVDLNTAVMPHFKMYLAKVRKPCTDGQRHAAMTEWANNFYCCAKVLGVTHRIKWDEWLALGVEIEGLSGGTRAREVGA